MYSVQSELVPRGTPHDVHLDRSGRSSVLGSSFVYDNYDSPVALFLLNITKGYDKVCAEKQPALCLCEYQQRAFPRFTLV
jgi:hypothetical protein